MTAKQTNQEAEKTAAPVARPNIAIPLQTPIVRSGEVIKTLHLMKPRTGDLRGLLLAELLQMKTDAVAKLIPRISTPTLTYQEVDDLDPADLVACSVEVAGFLVPKAAMESLDV